ncbi:hypothetical protein V5O48_018086 [Marasmius crinis-equi]|uniref:Uncharacterized protein n=1 Tax=Marasmius crinis-equi TaxID=585013 RepID=A0ABR3EM68_9AGAR
MDTDKRVDDRIAKTRQSLDARDLAGLTRALTDVAQLSEYVDISDLPAIKDAVFHNDALNDRYLLLERLLVLMSRLNDSTQTCKDLRKLGEDIEKFVIDFLYKDLPHPPSGYMSTLSGSAPQPPSSSSTKPGSIEYAYRSSDGSGYNPLFPTLGKAGTPYARSVPSTRSPPLSSLPDSGLVFDTLLKREKFVKHPGGISSLFFAFANLVIHSVFNTDIDHSTVNNSSSYLDLSILYGNSDEQVMKVRKQDGTGKMLEDVFADARLLLMPPATCALLVLLCRNHNYIADKIFRIKERRAYEDPQKLSDAGKKEQDDEIFNRARLVNSGYFVQIILGDYVGAILGQVRDGHDWRLDPLMEVRQANHELAPRGEGNVISIEFNLLYRWHATLSQEDEQWTKAEFQKYSQGDLFTVENFHNTLISAVSQIGDDPATWSFEGLQRGTDGRFKDEDLAKILIDATEYRAGAFKARGIPEALKAVEIMGIEAARKWGTCSLNEFRKFIGLKPYTSFEEWNADPSVAAAARSLYKHIDNLELYVGLQAEEAKEPGPGAGLCPGYTISRAILADAVCLTRGDRYLTVDFTPFNLTTWGYLDCQTNVHDGSYGGMLTKLLFRTLPEQYTPRSAYAHFPFLVPEFMRKALRKRDFQEVGKYDWERPVLPGRLRSGPYEVAQKIVGAQSGEGRGEQEFVNGWEKRLEDIIGEKLPDLNDLKFVQKYLIDHKEEWADFFVSLTEDLIREREIKHVGTNIRSVDIVKDVLNVLPVRWVCHHIMGLHIAPEPKENKTDVTEEEFCKMFQDVCQYVFLDLHTYNDWELRESSIATYNKLTQEVLKDFKSFDSFVWNLGNLIRDFFYNDSEDDSRGLLKKLWEYRGGADDEMLANALFCEVVPTAAHFAQAVAHVVNYYLDENRTEERNNLVEWSASYSAESKADAVKMVYAALTSDPPISGAWFTACKDSSVLGAGNIVKTGERLFVSLTPSPTPNESTSTSARENHVHHPSLGLGTHGLFLLPVFEAVAPRVIGTILGRTAIQRARGKSGEFNRFMEDYRGIPLQQYITYEGHVSPFPASLIVQYQV